MILVMFGLLLIPMLFMVGLSVDVGYWYNRASAMQRAADAASLAGVVWMPDIDKARTVARDVAAKNGFDDGVDNVTVVAEPSTIAPERRLRVTVSDSQVGSFFYEHLGGKRIPLGRTAYAEYVLPVPLGSPRNFFGTGTLLRTAGTDFDSEELYQSVNPYCTDKRNGDRYQSYSNGDECNGPTNSEYRDDGYSLYIEAPADRTSGIEVRLYDARYNWEEEVSGEPGCTTNWGNWRGPRSRWLDGLAQYWDGSTAITVEEGDSVYIRNASYRFGSVDCPIPDSSRDDGHETYTFTLYGPDGTPLNDHDNTPVPGCSEDYEYADAFDGYSFLGSQRWNTLCTIGVGEGWASGNYILRVTNGGAETDPMADGSNQWGLVAKYASSAGDGLCDGRTDDLCPRVYGTDAISVRAVSDADVAAFYLAEILAEHDGKTLKIELFDPGEGGSELRILMPTDTDAWGVEAEMDWSSSGGDSGSDDTVIALTTPDGPDNGSDPDDRFNGELLTIYVDLSGYDPPVDNEWWKIQYTFDGESVTDRTTWSATVIGDPIHLVEEY